MYRTTAVNTSLSETGTLHNGHDLFRDSHCSPHFVWNACWQSNLYISLYIGSRHIGHLSNASNGITFDVFVKCIHIYKRKMNLYTFYLYDSLIRDEILHNIVTNTKGTIFIPIHGTKTTGTFMNHFNGSTFLQCFLIVLGFLLTKHFFFQMNNSSCVTNQFDNEKDGYK